MVNDLDAVRELISRGLDADLDRVELRRLFLTVARDEAARQELGEMAALEEATAHLAAVSIPAAPLPDLAERVVTAVRDVPVVPPRPESRSPERPRLLERLRTLVAWPSSIGARVVLVMAGVALLVVVPLWGRVHFSDATRLVVHDLQFTDAQPRVTWTNQFIVPSGGETRFALKLGADKPLRIQFQTTETAAVRVIHSAPGSIRGSVNTFSIDGIGYATLRRPRTGDKVTIQNQGPVPLVVYVQGIGSDGTIFSHTPVDRRQAL
ncbi:MAG: hypothetical protein HQL66_07535 [Magnetococcales bacterium]|nr:hypothetical protein [Magnetococcales bacterium]